MAISVQYGPISAGLKLAQRSGEGEKFKWRFGAEQQLTDAAQQRRESDAGSRARDIQLAMASRQQQFGQTQALRQQATRAVQGQAASQMAQRQQGLREEQFEFQKEKFGKELPIKEQAAATAAAREERASQKVQDPTKAPAYRALEAITAPYQRQLERLQAEMEKAQSGFSLSDPRMVDAQMQQLRSLPINMPGGEQQTVGDLFDLKESYLAQALPMFQAAQQAEQIAQEKEMTEQKVDQVVNDLSNSLEPGTATPRIVQQVFQQLGQPQTPEEAQVVAEAVNEIEQNLRQQSGQAFPGAQRPMEHGTGGSF